MWREIIELLKLFFHNKFWKKNIILIGSPEHDNLGDYAISIAEMKFLNDKFPEYNIVELTSRFFMNHKNIVCECVKKKDIILITGGGFLGNLWMDEEKWVREVIKTFKKNKIIIMPQSIYFTEDDDGEKERKISQEIYQSHDNISIFLREKNSYEYVKKYFPKFKYIGLVPDIVTYMPDENAALERTGILLCLRTDKEGKQKLKNEILNLLGIKKMSYAEFSTIAEDRVNIDNRELKVAEKMRFIKESSLIITDRLHAMLFAAITSTPCIAIDNLTRKVSGVYEWIEYLPYISLCEDIDEINKSMEKFVLCKDKLYKYDNENLTCYYDEIAEIIMK